MPINLEDVILEAMLEPAGESDRPAIEDLEDLEDNEDGAQHSDEDWDADLPAHPA